MSGVPVSKLMRVLAPCLRRKCTKTWSSIKWDKENASSSHVVQSAESVSDPGRA